MMPDIGERAVREKLNSFGSSPVMDMVSSFSSWRRDHGVRLAMEAQEVAGGVHRPIRQPHLPGSLDDASGSAARGPRRRHKDIEWRGIGALEVGRAT